MWKKLRDPNDAGLLKKLSQAVHTSSALHAQELQNLLQENRTPNGIVVHVYPPKETYAYLRKLSKESGKPIGRISQHLTVEAIREGFHYNLKPGTRLWTTMMCISDLKPDYIAMRVPSKVYRTIEDLAWQFDIYKNSAVQLIGLALVYMCNQKTYSEWLEYFDSDEDILRPLVAALKEHLE